MENYNVQRARDAATREIERRRAQAERTREFGDDDAWVWRHFIYKVDRNTNLRSFDSWWVSDPVRVPSRTPRSQVPLADQIFDPQGQVEREPFQIYCGWCLKVQFR